MAGVKDQKGWGRKTFSEFELKVCSNPGLCVVKNRENVLVSDGDSNLDISISSTFELLK